MLGRFKRLCKALRRGSRGATLLEVLLAIVVLGLMLAAVPPVMLMISNSQFRQNELRIAESLSRSQFEYIKAQPYNNATSWLPEKEFPYDKIILEYPLENYAIYYNAEPIYPDPEDPNYGESSYPNDYGVQRITIKVFGFRLDPNDQTKYIYETTDYKVDRSLKLTGYELRQ